MGRIDSLQHYHEQLKIGTKTKSGKTKLANTTKKPKSIVQQAAVEQISATHG
jgi:hypothetical protein